MEAITASLEKSLQNCSLNNNNHHLTETETEREDGSAATDVGIGISSSSDDVSVNYVSNSDTTTLELNSHISLPYHWEQCLDLKTGEIYYINWRNGMKAKEDPRRVEVVEEYNNVRRDYESEEEEEESWYDSEESSSSESCQSSSKEKINYQGLMGEKQMNNNNNVLVVAGCKSCLMYFMVPKQVEDCPKCSGQLLHFDRSENNGSP